MRHLKELWMRCFGERLNKQEFQNIVNLLQSDNDEDFLLGRAILESRNIKLGRNRLLKICTEKYEFKYGCFIHSTTRLSRIEYEFTILNNQYTRRWIV